MPIGTTCPTPICASGMCTTKAVNCSFGYCCATGCCTGIQPQ
jgi:hypothetical protein